MAGFKLSVLACGLLALALPGNAASVPSIARRQVNFTELCNETTFASVVQQFGGEQWHGSPYTPDTEPAIRPDGQIQVLKYMKTILGINDTCGVRINVTSNIAFEMYLPHPDKWNNRTLTVGNGAFAGRTNRFDMFSRAVYGWAVMSTNTGHESDLSIGLSWGAGNKTLQQDWAWRAMSLSVPYAKAIANAYYNRTTNPETVKHYYSGCSTGGRQGIRQTEIDPNSFDGLLLGAPAWNVKSAMPVISRMAWITRNYGLDNIETRPFERFYDLVVEKCDIGLPNSFDIADDNIVSDSENCLKLFKDSGINGPVWHDYNCTNNDTPSNTCFTLRQREGLLSLFGSGAFTNPKDNTTYAGDGFDITSIKDIFNVYLESPTRDWFADQFSEYFIGERIPWDTPANGIRLLEQSDAWDQEVRANADGSVLKNPRLKTILYTGTADGTVSSYGTDRLYEAAGGESNPNLSYFKIPGMPHCVDNGFGGENPPWYIGQTGLAIVNAGAWFLPNVSGLFDADHDALTALTDWVEDRRERPTRFVATAFRNATGGDWTISRQRPVCASPLKQVFMGGDLNDLGRWKCE